MEKPQAVGITYTNTRGTVSVIHRCALPTGPFLRGFAVMTSKLRVRISKQRMAGHRAGIPEVGGLAQKQDEYQSGKDDKVYG